MPYRKKTYRKKRMYTKKYTKKRTTVRYSRKTLQPKYYFKRGSDLVSASGSDLTPTYLNALNFRLGSINNASEFTVLFDQFRLNLVVIKFRINIDPAAQTAANSNYPILYYVKDHDDSSVPADVGTIKQYSTYKQRVLFPNRYVSIAIKPSTLLQGYESSTATSYLPKWKQWIDMSDVNTEHFGLKYAVTGLYARYNLEYEIKYFFQCRTVR